MRLGSVALRTGSRLAAGTTGAIVGQAAIPVPILGAFIGGLVGGLMGGVISETV
jgi:phage tail tape-measure protein